MERFLSRSTVLVGLILLGCILAVPIAGELVFSNTLPERFRFENWPLWLQIPFGIVVALYIIGDIWFTTRMLGQRQRKHRL